MNYQDIDAYFFMATMGDEYAYRQIYAYFYNESEKVIIGVLSSCRNKSISSDEFSDLVSVLFMEAVNEYDFNRAPFSLFAKYLIQLKLVRRIIQLLKKNSEKVFSLDDCIDGEHSYHDIIGDENIEQDNVKTRFKYSLASKDTYRTREEKILDKVKLMLYCGYSQSEIAKYLRLSRNDIRKVINECKNDESIINLKMEIK